MERWDPGKMMEIVPGMSDMNWQSARVFCPELVEVADTGTTGNVMRVAHGLGRVPRGVVIVNSVVPSTSAVSWYRRATDEDWTAKAVYLRFDVSNARVLLMVF